MNQTRKKLFLGSTRWSD